MEQEQLQYRMYFLVMCNISPIQQGIQALHATVEYANKYFNNNDYKRWANVDKTVVILSGGTSNVHGWEHPVDGTLYGSMESSLQTLKDMGVNHASFNEPDLNGSTSAIALLASEKVYDRKKYPDAAYNMPAIYISDPAAMQKYKEDMQEKANANEYGADVAALRRFLGQFRLA